MVFTTDLLFDRINLSNATYIRVDKLFFKEFLISFTLFTLARKSVCC
jgi:hypothetical protein